MVLVWWCFAFKICCNKQKLCQIASTAAKGSKSGWQMNYSSVHPQEKETIRTFETPSLQLENYIPVDHGSVMAGALMCLSLAIDLPVTLVVDFVFSMEYAFRMS